MRRRITLRKRRITLRDLPKRYREPFAKDDDPGTELEQAAAQKLQLCGLCGYIREYRAVVGRNFRFDFAWIPERVALEIEGLVGEGKSRHTTWKGYSDDCEKYNLAQLDGWLVIRATQTHVRSGVFLDWVERALEMRK